MHRVAATQAFWYRANLLSTFPAAIHCHDDPGVITGYKEK